MVKGIAAWLLCITLAFAWSGTGLAADKANFSGKYSQVRGALNATLDVMQNPDSIEITRVEKDKTMHGRCPLDGSWGDYTARSGTAQKCKARLKGDRLVLEWTDMTAEADPKPMRGKEQWQLSADLKTLTIKSELSLPKGISIVMNETFIRMENR